MINSILQNLFRRRSIFEKMDNFSLTRKALNQHTNIRRLVIRKAKTIFCIENRTTSNSYYFIITFKFQISALFIVVHRTFGDCITDCALQIRRNHHVRRGCSKHWRKNAHRPVRTFSEQQILFVDIYEYY